jgi:hypothetical protein
MREDIERKCGRGAHDVDPIVSYKDGCTDDYSNPQELRVAPPPNFRQ